MVTKHARIRISTANVWKSEFWTKTLAKRAWIDEMETFTERQSFWEEQKKYMQICEV